MRAAGLGAVAILLLAPLGCADAADMQARPVLKAPPPAAETWFAAEALAWWAKGDRPPPLVTTSPDGTPIFQAGVLGQPGTTILFGNQAVADDARAGVRISAGA